MEDQLITKGESSEAYEYFTTICVKGVTTWAGFDTETDQNDVILAGFDAVAYQTAGKPVPGKAQYTATYNNAVYRFSSASNRDKFRANPGKYAPAYGGYCAYGMSFGKKFSVDGKAFEVVNGILYVNKNLAVYETWREDIPGNIQKADTQWPRVKNIDPAKL